MKTPNHRTLILAGGILAFAGSLRAEDLPVKQRLDKIEYHAELRGSGPDQLRGGNGNRHPLRGHKTERDDGYHTGTGQRAAKTARFR